MRGDLLVVGVKKWWGGQRGSGCDVESRFSLCTCSCFVVLIVIAKFIFNCVQRIWFLQKKKRRKERDHVEGLR